MLVLIWRYRWLLAMLALAVMLVSIDGQCAPPPVYPGG